MAKQIVIERPNGTVTIVRSELETASEDPLTEHEQIINELYSKVKNLGLFSVRLSLLDLDKIKQQGKAYANQYKTQASSEGLENIADDFQNGARWALEFLRNEA